MAKKEFKNTITYSLPKWGSRILHTPTRRLSTSYIKTSEFKKHIKKMFKLNAMSRVAGIAANQIGIPLRMAVIEIKFHKSRPEIKPVPRTIIINPEILSQSKEFQYGWESCVSIPGEDKLFFYTARPKNLKVQYINEKGKTVVREISGLEGRAFHHEIDHLDGIVCAERLLVVDGKVAKGAVISRSELKKNPKQVPVGFIEFQSKIA